MTFVSTGVVEKGDTEFVVTGDLTIKDVTKSVELAVEFLGEGKDPWGGTRVGVEATTTDQPQGRSASTSTSRSRATRS